MEWPLAAYIGFDRGRGPSKTAVWQWTRHADGLYSWRELSPEEFYAAPRDEDFIAIDDFPDWRYSGPVTRVRDKPKLTKPQPKPKLWVQLNNKPAWLRRK